MQQSLRRSDPFQRTKEERRAARPECDNSSSSSGQHADDEDDGKKWLAPAAAPARASQQSQWSWPQVLCLGVVAAICACLLSVAAYKQYLASEAQLVQLSPRPQAAGVIRSAASVAAHRSPSTVPAVQPSAAAAALVESSGREVQRKGRYDSTKRDDSHKLKHKHKRHARQVYPTLQTELNGAASSHYAVSQSASR
eukprot:TRINITY_DN38191_c0_g1_i1.p1 TRINITY_DN38191_c0_g1~~TRINITY_DN38191_c0_g1_i1.p1  ORF type:complete len:196 (+),score=50.16 TRINITY_DN38191_c0_g1_i1:115-702(+)